MGKMQPDIDQPHVAGIGSSALPTSAPDLAANEPASQRFLRGSPRAWQWAVDERAMTLAHDPTHDTFAFDRCVVERAQRQLLIDAEPIKIGARALDILLVLIEHRDRVVSKNELLELVWPGLVVEENNLQVHVSALRKILGSSTIATIPGRGYRFAARLNDCAPRTQIAPPSAPNASSKSEPRSNLARILPPLYGREEDSAALCELVERNRLVTVVGAGGMGKTVLAEAVANRLREHYPGGVFKVELALLKDGWRVVHAITAAMQVKLNGCAAISAIATANLSRPMLLLLDNCEHVLDDVAKVVNDVLCMTSCISILTTSQALLKLPSEQVFRIRPLALPGETTVADARQFGAIALFEARALAANPSFALTENNIVATIDICTRLDGMALAIELAAARVSLLGVDGLRSHLGERFRVLTGGSRLALPRHRTLNAAVDWSHNLLAPAEQAVFARLGVFVGSFGLDAARHVAADDQMDSWAVLDHLGALVDKSLLIVEPDSAGVPRYRLLETLRHFALARLAQIEEARRVRARHLDFYLALTETARGELVGLQQGAWLARLDIERGNLHAAHDCCDESENGGELGLRLVNALMRFWLNRGLLEQGHRAYLRALARAGAETATKLRCEALLHVGWLCEYRGLFKEAETHLKESAAIAREDNFIELLANALSRLGFVLLSVHDYAAARACLEEARAVATQCNADADLGGQVVTAIAELERLEGHLDSARGLYEEGLMHARARGDRLRTMISLNNLAMVAALEGAPARARTMLIESLAICDELDSQRGRLVVMEVCAGLAARRGHWQCAACFNGAAVFHTEQIGRHRDVADEAFLRPFLQRAREALGEREFELAENTGRAMTYEIAIANLREWLKPTL